MKGQILDYSIQTNTGAISGDDNNRYTFTGAELRITGPPRRGLRVDFDPDGNVATAIYGEIPAKDASPEPERTPGNSSVALAVPAEVNAGQGLASPVRGLVRSRAAVLQRNLSSPIRSYATPSTLVIDAEFASPMRRVVAWFVDTVFLFGTLGIGLLVWMLIAAILGRSGQSLGKAMLGIRVVRLDGSAPGFGLMLRRTLCRFLTSYIFPFANIISFVMILTDDNRHQSIHDRMAGTLVVRKR